MQSPSRGRHPWRAVVAFLIFAFAAQPIVGQPGIATAAGQPFNGRPPAAPVIEPAANADLPPQAAGAALDATGREHSPATPMDRVGRRGEIRPPKPEPAGTIVAGRSDRFTRTTSTGDGTYVATTGGAPLNYRSADGTWQAIDLSLVPAAPASGFDLQTRANDRLVELSDRTHRNLARLSGRADSLVLGSPDLAGSAAASRSGNRARYGGGQALSVEISPIAEGLYFTATLQNASAPLSVRFTLDVGDLTPTLSPDGSISLHDDATNRLVFAIERPTLIDAAGRRSFDVAAEISERPGNAPRQAITVTYTISADTASALTYPLIIDPAIVLWPTNAGTSLRIVDGATGAPVSGVDCTGPGPTDAYGICGPRQLDPDLEATTTLTKTGYFTKTVEYTPYPGGIVTIPIWATTTSQTVKVVDGSGAPVSGAAVTDPTNGTRACPGTTTAADGMCLITGVNPDLLIDLTVTKSGFFAKQLVFIPSPGSQRTITVWAASTSQTIKVIDGASSAAVSGLGVVMSTPTNGTVACPGSTTAADGTCIITGVNPDTDISLSLSKTGYFSKSVDLIPTIGNQLTVKVWATGTTQSVKLVNGSGGAGVSGVTVTMHTPSNGTVACPGTTTAADGTCLITGVNPDQGIPLLVSKTGFFGPTCYSGYPCAKVAPLVPSPGAEQPIKIWSITTARTVRVTDALTGAAIAGASVTADTGTVACPGTNTAADGTCVITSTDPDRVLTLALSKTGYWTRTVEGTVGDASDIATTLWPTSFSQLVEVVDGVTGSPVAGVSVSSCSTVTSGDGRCTIAGVDPALPLTITLTLTGYYTKTLTVTPSTGVIAVTFTHGGSGSSLSLVEINSANAFSEGDATVTVGRSGGTIYRLYTTLQPPILPDGAQISQASLRLVSATKGAETVPVTVRPITSAWSPAAMSWSNQPAVGDVISTMVVGQAEPEDDPPFAITSWAQTAFVRTVKGAADIWGLAIMGADETNGSYVVFEGDALQSANRPSLTIAYRVAAATIDFAEVLGKNFAPSTMLVGATTTLPLIVRNTGWGVWKAAGTDRTVLAYRWLDRDGALLNVAGFTPFGQVALAADVPSGYSASVNLPVLAPPAATSATLRLDVASVVNNATLYFSDGALLDLYDEPVVPADADDGYAAYVGSSVVKRTEYQVEIVEEANAVALGTGLAEGGSLAMDGLTGVLTYGTSDLAVADRGPGLSFSRTYSSANRTRCDGVLAACGWSTSADQRIDGTLSGTPTYVDPTGGRHSGSFDAQGQLRFTGAVTGDLQRRRVTIIDEAARTGWTGTTPTPVTTPVSAGSYAYQLAANTSGTLGGISLPLATYPVVTYKTRTVSGNESAVTFTLTDQFGRTITLAYVRGTTFTTGATYTIVDATPSSVGTFAATSHNLYVDALAQDSALGRELTVSAVKLTSTTTGGITTWDELRLAPTTATLVADAMPSWTSGGTAATLDTVDRHLGTASIRVTPPAAASDATNVPAQTLTNTHLAAMPFLSWAWKKATGTSVAVWVSVRDQFSGQTGDLVYYAGAALKITSVANGGAAALPAYAGVSQISVGDALPPVWTEVHRNVLEDARNAFGWRADVTRTLPVPRGFGAHGDFVEVTGWKLVPYDGLNARFDEIRLDSSAGAAADTTKDWVLLRPDGSYRAFNDAGRLVSAVDASGNSQAFTWTYTAGTDTWRLDRIAQGYDTNRALAFTYPSAGVTTITDVQGRAVTLTVIAQDLVSAVSFRAGSTTYLYDAAHRLTAVRDPRYTAGNDYQTTIAYDGSGKAYTIYQGAVTANVPLAKVLSRTAAITPSLTGIQIQTAQQLAANTSQLIELDPNGSRVREYAPRTGTTLPTAADLRMITGFDGIAQATTTTRYRTAGQQNPLIERQGSAARASLNAFHVPFAAIRVPWTQSAAEYAASTDAARLQYRTFTGYDAANNPVMNRDATGHAIYRAYDASHRLIGTDDNFLANSGFEGSLAGWTSLGYVALQEGDASSGDHAARLTSGWSAGTLAGVYETNSGGVPQGGYVDTAGGAATFYGPTGTAYDPTTGYLYVADSYNHVIRRIAPDGTVSAFAGLAGAAGLGDGIGAAARFNTPYAVAVSTSGDLFVADRANHTIRKITPAGVVTTLAGRPGIKGGLNGTGSAAAFASPSGIAIDASGNLFVADTETCSIRKVTQAGVVTTIAGPLSGGSGICQNADGTGSAASFKGAYGITLDPGTSNLYVADAGAHTIRKVTQAGVVTTIAGLASTAGFVDGTGSVARLTSPAGIAIDPTGVLWVGDTTTIRKITLAGVVTTVAGVGGTAGSLDGTGTAARLNGPKGFSFDGAGTLYTAEAGNHMIRRITSAVVVTTLAGIAGKSGSVNTGAGAGAARFNRPQGIATDAEGNVYVADGLNNTIRKLTASNTVSTLAGLAGVAGWVDGAGSIARFSSPGGLVADTAGNLFLAGGGDKAIRRITPTGVVTTFAGSLGNAGTADGTGTAARFSNPTGIAIDGSGNLFVADCGGPTIRKITPAGVVTTLAGLANTSGSVDGTGSAARFNCPRGIEIDASGVLYVTDSNNHTIRKVTGAGVVTTLAGTAGSAGSVDGTGSVARFNYPAGMALDATGNIVVADESNHTIRAITPAGVVTTIAGLAGQQSFTDGVGAATRFRNPKDLAMDGSGNLYLTDMMNHLIRTIAPQSAARQVVTLAAGGTFRFQAALKVASGTPSATYAVDYWRTSTNAWTTLIPTTSDAGTSWHTVAVDATIPLDSDGRLRVTMAMTGTGTVLLDNVALLTTAQTMTYDAFGNPSTTTDLLGRVQHAYYDVDPAGNHAAGVYQTRTISNEVGGGSNADQNVTTTVTRNKLGAVLTSTDPIGRVTTTVYAINGTDTASVTDPAGGKTTFTYDVGGRVLTSVAPNGNVSGGTPSLHTTTRVYDGMGRATDVTDPLGKVSHTTYDVAGHTIATFEQYTGGGTPLSGLANLKTTTTYDGDGLPISTVVDAGAGNLALTTTYTYDQLSHRVTETDPAGRVMTTYYDAAGRAAGVRAAIAPSGAPAPLCPGQASTRCNSLTTYDVLSRPSSVTDAAGNATTTRYDVNGQQVSLTNGRGYTTTIRYDLAARPISTTGATGAVSTTTYDALDRPIIETAPDTTFTKTVYDRASQMIDTSAPAAAGSADAALNWTHQTYDLAGRSLSTTAHYVSGGSATADQNVLVKTNTYDANGNTLTTTGAPGTVGGAGLVTKATFDTLNRTTTLITNYVSGGPTDNQTNLTTTYAYDTLGHAISETDPAGVVTRSEYDRAHRLSAVIQNYISGQPATASQNVRSQYGYNAAGELTSYCPPVSVAAGNCLSAFWNYARDGFGNVSAQTAPTGSSLGAISATYDPAGRLASSNDGLHAQAYTYDANHNVTGIVASGGGAATITSTYAYDALDRRTSASNGTDTLTFEYDTLNRPTAVKRAGVTISGATYNPDGTLATSIQPAGTASFTYDGMLRLATAAMPALFSGSATFTWRPDGLLGARAWPAGTNETFTYDAAKRPSQLLVKTAGNTTLATISTTFDRVGNLTTESQVIPGISGLAGNSTLTFTNDPLRRTTGYTISGGATVTYTYNANSNRLSAGTTTFTYNTADQLINQTVAGVTRTFAYDAAGNQTSSPVSPTTNSSFTYDALNQPLSVAVPSQPTVTYTYDALGRRASRTAAGATETYGYVGELIARIDRGGGNVTDSAIDAMGDRLTVGSAWTLPNVRGDVAGLLNSSQTAVSDAYRYDPFGVTLNTAGSSLNPYRFQGRLLESTSGQYDFGARQYDPAIAAFTSLDTVMGQAQNPLSLNRYLYAHANPEVMIDLDGHRAIDPRDAGYAQAVASARAAVAAARQAVGAAASAYLRAVIAAATAHARLNDPCVGPSCSERDFLETWRQNRLSAYSSAAAVARTAKTRYDAAVATLRSAEGALKAALATKPKASGSPDDRGGGRAPTPRDCGPAGIGCVDFRPVAVVAGVALAVAACVALCPVAAVGGAVAGTAVAVGSVATAACIRLCPAARTGLQIANESNGGAGTPSGAVVSAAEVGTKLRPLVIGENMTRVRQFATEIGGRAYTPLKNSPFDEALAVRRNERMIRDAVRSGTEIVDIGPDFARRASGGGASPFYNLERRLTSGYDNYTKAFERFGSDKGGVAGLDF